MYWSTDGVKTTLHISRMSKWWNFILEFSVYFPIPGCQRKPSRNAMIVFFCCIFEFHLCKMISKGYTFISIYQGCAVNPTLKLTFLVMMFLYLIIILKFVHVLIFDTISSINAQLKFIFLLVVHLNSRSRICVILYLCVSVCICNNNKMILHSSDKSPPLIQWALAHSIPLMWVDPFQEPKWR